MRDGSLRVSCGWVSALERCWLVVCNEGELGPRPTAINSSSINLINRPNITTLSVTKSISA